MRVEWENLESCVRLRSMREWISFRSSVWLGFAASASRRELSLKCDESSLSFFPDHCCLLRQFCYWFSTYHQHPHRAAAKKNEILPSSTANNEKMMNLRCSACEFVSHIFFIYMSTIVDCRYIPGQHRQWTTYRMDREENNKSRKSIHRTTREWAWMDLYESELKLNNFAFMIAGSRLFSDFRAIHPRLLLAALELSRVTNWIPLIQLCG